MSGRISTDMGEILVDEEVIAKYAGSAAVGCAGVVGMASTNMKDGFAKLLKRDNVAHGVKVLVRDRRLQINLHIIVVYENVIMTIARNLIKDVKYKVEEFTGMEVEKITVSVEGVRRME